MDFYEKALFVKVDVATAVVAERNCSSALSALCFYPHSQVSSLSLVARCIDEIRLFGLKGAAIFRAVFLLEGGPSSHVRSRLMLDPKRIRATIAVAIRHFRVASPLVAVSSPPLRLYLLHRLLSRLSCLLPRCGADGRCRADRRPLLLPTGGARAPQSFLATATTARFFAFLPPREAIFSPWRLRSESEPKGPRM